eukprot:tig00021036_g17328.t1
MELPNLSLAGLERSRGGTGLQELIVVGADPFRGTGGPGSASALASLPALRDLTVDTAGNGNFAKTPAEARPALPPPPPGAFSALRILALCGPSTRTDWWAAVLSSPVGAALQELSLDDVLESDALLRALASSGPALALQSLALQSCDLGSTGLLTRVLAASPALASLAIACCRKAKLLRVLQAVAPVAPLQELCWSVHQNEEDWSASKLARFVGDMGEAVRLLRGLDARGVEVTVPLALDRLVSGYRQRREFSSEDDESSESSGGDDGGCDDDDDHPAPSAAAGSEPNANSRSKKLLIKKKRRRRNVVIDSDEEEEDPEFDREGGGGRRRRKVIVHDDEEDQDGENKR